MNKGQRQPLSQLTINSSCFEDALNMPPHPITRTVGQEHSAPRTIARSTSTPELLVDALKMPATPLMKLNTPMEIMNSPTRRRLADDNYNTPPSAKKVKHFNESLPVINVIMI